ncbi:hypothetical protein [Burkholderia latens]|uniref:hypothetical protein n=1 Tax=Burkholderia latens TaxID=488446 RepID=UPI0021BBDA18|nr:hypothetical protein [Burkholderia latens]
MSSSNEDRVSYETIKAWALDAYFNFCRDSALMEGASHREVLGHVDLNFEGVYKSQIENLMLCVVQLILSGGWYPDAERSMRKSIVDQISTEGLDNLLKGVPSEEVELFVHDLRILKFIQ